MSAVADWAGGVSRYVFHYGEMEQELQDLEKKVAELEGELREGQEAIQENARLRELLGLRSKRQDLTFESAKVTARSASNWQSTLTLSKGGGGGAPAGELRHHLHRRAGGRGVQGGQPHRHRKYGHRHQHGDGRHHHRTNSAGVLEGILP